MTPIIFLDIDGVLQFSSSERFKKNLDQLKLDLSEKFAIKAFLDYDKYDVGAVYYDWDKEAVNRFKQLIEKTNARIVLSSTWRLSKNIETMRHLMLIHELDHYLIDYTPNLNYDRPAEIEQFLTKHPEIRQFVIIDDDCYDLSRKFPDNFVCTSKEMLFSAENLEQSIQILTHTK